ncbi:peptidoglycan-binding protein [Flavivirga eckloniae]|uniref:Peptidoglycan-binding protein n=1 Tax=Flavivirga eckloniae TaxID=1803846 RepID=A0A2K9PPR5_9FLAO|nr:peptidoglycan-binding protein [Flavivirga eckloniae]AUP79061.1 peptidoglycan-binding protein [Flavivirga eckloniae]
MRKTFYKKELVISNTQKRRGNKNKRSDVIKIQSWLCLQEQLFPGIGTMTAIDGDFGPATEKCVKNFQKFININETGIVDQDLFSALSHPLKSAFEDVTAQATIRETILKVAENHLKNQPKELVIKGENNSGPWVKSYMDGHEGELWFWCMGFVQGIIDQALSLHDMKFTKIMPLTYSCDVVGMKGLEHDSLIRNSKIEQQPNLVKPGDILLIRRSWHDWTHTAIIIDVEDETFTTIEGNTNRSGSRNGDGVYKRVRNFQKSNLDVFSLEKWID